MVLYRYYNGNLAKTVLQPKLTRVLDETHASLTFAHTRERARAINKYVRVECMHGAIYIKQTRRQDALQITGASIKFGDGEIQFGGHTHRVSSLCRRKVKTICIS